MNADASSKIILITGCSSGFGLLSAVQLAKRGWKVYATMRNTSAAQELLDKAAEHKTSVIVRALDVTKPETIDAIVREIKEKHGRIDVLINNAGFGLGGFFEDLSDADIRRQFDVNFFGVQQVCREVIPMMRQERSGLIINISSIAGQTGTPALGAYNASKWALEGFSESLYHELALFNIKVVLVEPGSYPTKIFSGNARYSEGFDDPKSPYFKLSQALRAYVKREMARNKKDPQDVARLIERIIDTPRPRLRYIPDLASRLRVMLAKIMPPPLYNYIFRKVIYGKLSDSL